MGNVTQKAMTALDLLCPIPPLQRNEEGPLRVPAGGWSAVGATPQTDLNQGEPEEPAETNALGDSEQNRQKCPEAGREARFVSCRRGEHKEEGTGIKVTAHLGVPGFCHNGQVGL